jgi:hypothetical protein
MLYYVIDPKTDEELGEIDCDDDEILDALEDSDYIEDARTCQLVSRPDDEWHVSQNGAVILWISNRGPDDDDDDDEFEDEDD